MGICHINPVMALPAGRFDTDSIIGAGDEAVADFHLAASHNIDSVCIRHMTVSVYDHIFHLYLAAAVQHQGPVQSILNHDIGYLHILTAADPYGIHGTADGRQPLLVAVLRVADPGPVGIADGIDRIPHGIIQIRRQKSLFKWSRQRSFEGQVNEILSVSDDPAAAFYGNIPPAGAGHQRIFVAVQILGSTDGRIPVNP